LRSERAPRLQKGDLRSAAWWRQMPSKVANARIHHQARRGKLGGLPYGWVKDQKPWRECDRDAPVI